MEMRIYELPPIGTNAYLLINGDSGEAVLFDAPMSAWAAITPHLKEAACSLRGLYLTHGHWDHILDVGSIIDQGISVHAHRGDVDLIESPQAMAEFSIAGIKFRPGKVDHYISDGDRFELWGHSVEVRHVPGHSEGSILYYFASAGFAITGDAIFAGSIGRTDFPGCSLGVLQRSIQKRIYTLPDETILYPGHGPKTTVARERTTNPFVRARP